jgi:1,3-beta-glucanosyltransferase GAS5
MTSVYSGGLVYEYTMAENKYGVVEIEGSSVKELPEFSALATAFKNNPAPSDDGGYKQNGAPSSCPPQSSDWKVQNDSLPNMPTGAKKFFDSGAGTGPGLKTGDKGSQWAGTPSSGWGMAGNSTSEKKDSKKKSEAGVVLPQPILLTVLLLIIGLIGA